MTYIFSTKINIQKHFLMTLKLYLYLDVFLDVFGMEEA